VHIHRLNNFWFENWDGLCILSAREVDAILMLSILFFFCNLEFLRIEMCSISGGLGLLVILWLQPPGHVLLISGEVLFKLLLEPSM
jgi:hypothetical protein